MSLLFIEQCARYVLTELKPYSSLSVQSWASATSDRRYTWGSLAGEDLVMPASPTQVQTRGVRSDKEPWEKTPSTKAWLLFS